MSENNNKLTKQDHEMIREAKMQLDIYNNQFEEVRRGLEQAKGAYNFVIGVLQKKYKLSPTDQISLDDGTINRKIQEAVELSDG